MLLLLNSFNPEKRAICHWLSSINPSLRFFCFLLLFASALHCQILLPPRTRSLFGVTLWFRIVWYSKSPDFASISSLDHDTHSSPTTHVPQSVLSIHVSIVVSGSREFCACILLSRLCPVMKRKIMHCLFRLSAIDIICLPLDSSHILVLSSSQSMRFDYLLARILFLVLATILCPWISRYTCYRKMCSVTSHILASNVVKLRGTEKNKTAFEHLLLPPVIMLTNHNVQSLDEWDSPARKRWKQ